MGHLLTVLQNKKIYLQDGYNRLDDATTMGNANTGQPYVPALGTWGISGGRAYNVSDVAGEVTLIESGKADYYLYCITNGQTTGTTNQRYLNIVFRANDSVNFLMARVSNAIVALWKNVAGTLTYITSTAYPDTDNVDIRFAIRCAGNQVNVYVSGVLYITYTLVAQETVFSSYTKVGYRLSKAGTPTGTARADNMRIESL